MASGLASLLERHIDDGLRLGDLDDQFVALNAPLAGGEHGDQDALIIVGQRLQDGGLQLFDLVGARRRCESAGTGSDGCGWGFARCGPAQRQQRRS